MSNEYDLVERGFSPGATSTAALHLGHRVKPPVLPATLEDALKRETKPTPEDELTVFNADWVKYLHNREQVVEPKYAFHLLKQFRYPNQTRDKTPDGIAHIEVLAEIMRRGDWTPHRQITFARFGSLLWIVDGHHRLSAQINSGATITWQFIVHDCATMDEVKKLYAKFNTNERERSEEQILKAAEYHKTLETSKTMAADVYKAIPLINAKFKLGRNDRTHVKNRISEDRMAVGEEFAQEAQILEKCLKKALPDIRRQIRNGGSLAVALVTLKHQPEKAQEFWKGVGEDDGLKIGDPRRTYLRALQGSTTKDATLYWTAVAAATAWNAYYKGKELKQVKVMDGKASVEIAGTPYKG